MPFVTTVGALKLPAERVKVMLGYPAAEEDDMRKLKSDLLPSSESSSNNDVASEAVGVLLAEFKCNKLFPKTTGLVPTPTVPNTRQFVAVALTKEKFCTERLLPEAEEKARFVVVTLVDVTLPKFPFQRSAAEPSAKVASLTGIKFVFTRPETAKFVVVTLVAVPSAKVKP